jgi:hypothetical protein
MKKTFISIATVLVLHMAAYAQTLQSAVAQLEKATTATAFQQLATQFEQLANSTPNNWLPWYYAAYCNAKTGWLYQDDGERIEPFADKADQQIARALSLLDTTKQKKELSEIYVVKSIINRDRVFINPMTYGRKYGPDAAKYVQLALKSDPANGRALYLAGWEKYVTPKMWGGDKKKAKELLQQAKQHLNAQTNTDLNPHWGQQETEELLGKL